MPLPTSLRSRLTLPAICAPMFRVTGPALVREACKAGIIGGLPRHNARGREEAEAWLSGIRDDLDAYSANHPDARVGPIAVNVTGRLSADELKAELELCRRYGVEIIISAMGDPTEIIQRSHDWGALVFHDVTNLRFAEKAIRAGADGLTCIGAGGGGNSGTISHLTLIPKVRSLFDGVVIMAGAISTGAAIRAGEILGADLAYLGTRFIATQESDAPQAYKDLLVSEGAADLTYTRDITGVPCNWLSRSLRDAGLDPANLPAPTGGIYKRDHLPPGVKPWSNMWSAGQGIDLIDDIPTVSDVVARLRNEYVAACRLPDMAYAAGQTSASGEGPVGAGQASATPPSAPARARSH